MELRTVPSIMLRRPAPELLATLSTRQMQVCSLTAAGMTAKQVALALGIAPDRARNHLRAAMTKIGVATPQSLGAVLALSGLASVRVMQGTHQPRSSRAGATRPMPGERRRARCRAST